MKEEYKNFVAIITPYIAYACRRYISEQKEHLEFLKSSGILKEEGYQESLKELNHFIEIDSRLFDDLRNSFGLLFELFDNDLKENYQDPDTLMFSQIQERVTILLKEYYQCKKLNKSFRHDLVCIHNFLESYFYDDLSDPDPYECTWKPTQLENGMSASTMLRTKLIFMDDTDLHLSNQYDYLQNKLNEVKKELFKKSMKRCLMIGLDRDILDIERLVDNLDSLWV